MPLAQVTAERFEIASVTLPYLDGVDAPQVLQLNQVYGWSNNQNSSWSRCRVGGSVDALAHIIGRGKPSVSLNTRDLDRYFSVISPTIGLRIESQPVTSTNPIFRLYERQHGGAFMDLDEPASHAKIEAPGGGMIYPDTLTCNVEDTDGASMSTMFVPVWDGSVQPFVFSHPVDQSDAAHIPTFNSQFFLGPVFHGGTEWRGATGITVPFGLQVTGTTQTPGPYDRAYAVSDREPQIQIRGLKLDEIQSLFSNSVSSEFACYLWAGANAGDRIAKATSAHIKISCTAGAIEHATVGGDVPNDAEDAIVVRPIGPIAVAINQVIPPEP